jgi:hypothetical protein
MIPQAIFMSPSSCTDILELPWDMLYQVVIRRGESDACRFTSCCRALFVMHRTYTNSEAVKPFQGCVLKESKQLTYLPTPSSMFSLPGTVYYYILLLASSVLQLTYLPTPSSMFSLPGTVYYYILLLASSVLNE